MIRTQRTVAALVLTMIAFLPFCAHPQGGQLAAQVGDETITREELLNKFVADNYELVRETLEQMATEKLIATEAAARGISTDELVKIEVDDKVGEPTDEDIEKFYAENVDIARRYGEIDKLRERIARTLTLQRADELREQFVRTLKTDYGYRMLVDPPRFEIALGPDDLVRGPDDAPITVVEFTDFQCTHCRSAHLIVEQLMLEYGDQLRFVHRDYPLPNHLQALAAAEAAHCAADQGKFWEYHEHLMMMSGDLGDKDLAKRAEGVGLDVEEFTTCLQSGRHRELIQQHFDSGKAVGVTGIPTFFINGRRIAGGKSYEKLKTVIEEELARAAVPANAGG